MNRLAEVRGPWCVSLYGSREDWGSGPGGADGADGQIREVESRLHAAGASRETVRGIRERLDGVREWLSADAAVKDRRTQAVAVFLADDTVDAFALSTAPVPVVSVSDRHLISPLLEAASALVPPVYTLALSENEVRLIDVTAGRAVPLAVEGLPKDLVSVVRLDLTGDRDTLAHLRTSEDPKGRLRTFARAVDEAVVPVLRRDGAVLLIAAAEPLAEIYRAQTVAQPLVATVLAGNHDSETPERIASAATPLIEDYRRLVIKEELARFDELPSRDRVLVGLDEVEEAAVSGAIDTLLVDTACRIAVPAEAFDMHTSVDRIDMIVRAALRHDSRVIPVRASDLPTGDPVAAVLRYAFVPTSRTRSVVAK